MPSAANAQAGPVKERLGKQLGAIDMLALHRGLVSSLAQALREGVPGERLDLSRLPQMASGPGRGRVPALSPAQQKLTDDVETLRKQVYECFMAQMQSVGGSEQESTLRAQGDELKGRLADAEAQLLALEQRRRAGLGAPQVDVAILVAALERLLTDDGRVGQHQVGPLDSVLSGLSMVQTSGSWECEATWRLPLTDGAADVGPIAFTVVKDRAKGMTVAMDNLGEAGNREQWSPADLALLSGHGLTHRAATVALACPIRHLLPALLAGLGHTPLPADVPPAWGQPEFAAWLVRVYTDPGFSGGRDYMSMPFARQRMLDTVVDLGGTTTVDVVCRALEIGRNRFKKDNVGLRSSFTGEMVTVPLLEVYEQFRGGRRAPARVSLLRCVCGAELTLAVTAPEVPRRLLCVCGRMPDCERWGLPASLRFPQEYRMLSPTPEQVRYFFSRSGTPYERLRKPTRTLLALPGMNDGLGMSTVEIAQVMELKLDTARATLKRLEMSGLVARVEATADRLSGGQASYWLTLPR